MEIRYRKTVIHQSVDGVEMETEVMLPDFGDEPGGKPIGIWGRRQLQYIREHRRVLYAERRMSGRMNGYLAELNEEAEDMLFRLVQQMAEREGVTEALKAKDAMKWTQAMNNILNCAEEVVYNDLIYN